MKLLYNLALTALCVVLISCRCSAQTTNLPTNLAAVAGDGSITLTWTPAAGSSYSEVMESTSANGPFQQAGTVTDASSGDTFLLTSLTNNLTYYFYIVPVGSGVPSATVSASTSVPAPTNLTATPGDAQVTLNWTASGGVGADNYNVYGASSASGPFSLLGNTLNQTTITTFVQSGLVNGDTYYYYVVPVNAGGTGASTPTVSTSVVLPSPTQLTATPGDGIESLNWTASSAPRASYYNVYQATSASGPFTEIGNTFGLASTTAYTQAGLVNETTYYYYVVPVNDGGIGVQSSTTSSELTLPAPTNVTATSGPGSVTLNWSASAAPGAYYYEIYESSTPNGTFSNIGTTEGQSSQTTYTQTGIPTGATYYYYVVPVDSGGPGIA